MITEEKKYYKVLTKDLRAPNQKWFSYKDWQTKTFEVEGSLKMCAKGLHLYTSLKYLSVGKFGERVFEAKSIGEHISNKNKICCRKVKLIRELKPEEVKDSEWAYHYCCEVEDKPEVRKNITDSEWAYYYCRYVKDNPEICNNITKSEWAYQYCFNIRDIPKIYKRITASEWAYCYCYSVKDRPEVRKNIIDSVWAYYYCRYVKDRQEIYKHITSPTWAYAYCCDVKSRHQIYKNIAIFSLNYWCCLLGLLRSKK